MRKKVNEYLMRKKVNEYRQIITPEILLERDAVVVLEDPEPFCRVDLDLGKEVFREYQRPWSDRIMPHAVLWFFLGAAFYDVVTGGKFAG